MPSRPGSGEARGRPDLTMLDTGFPTHSLPRPGSQSAARNVLRGQEDPMGPILAFALPLSVFHSPLQCSQGSCRSSEEREKPPHGVPPFLCCSQEVLRANLYYSKNGFGYSNINLSYSLQLIKKCTIPECWLHPHTLKSHPENSQHPDSKTCLRPHQTCLFWTTNSKAIESLPQTFDSGSSKPPMVEILWAPGLPPSHFLFHFFFFFLRQS